MGIGSVRVLRGERHRYQPEMCLAARGRERVWSARLPDSASRKSTSRCSVAGPDQDDEASIHEFRARGRSDGARREMPPSSLTALLARWSHQASTKGRGTADPAPPTLRALSLAPRAGVREGFGVLRLRRGHGPRLSPVSASTSVHCSERSAASDDRPRFSMNTAMIVSTPVADTERMA